MIKSIILASKSNVRKKILEEHGIKCEVITSKINEDLIKESLLEAKATPELISKNMAELKANKVSEKNYDKLVLGVDSVIDLNGRLVNKPKDRNEAKSILKKLNGQTHKLISSICISKNGFMNWNFTDSSTLKMKKLSDREISEYLDKLEDKILYAYGVYQIESMGKNLFEEIEGDKNTIMGLPINHLKVYLDKYN